MDEYLSPNGIFLMPSVFRITSLARAAQSPRGYRMDAILYHDRASMTVTWTVNQPDTRLKPGSLVSPRYRSRANCQNGVLEISRVVLLEQSIRAEDLFMTVPGDWVEDRALLDRASALWQRLPLAWQELVNGVLWQGDRFRRFCLGPSSVSGHHCERNGNLRHMVETAETVEALLPKHPAAHPDVALAAALLHDVAKADDYRPTQSGWVLTDHGRLIGHKLTIGDWIAVAQSRMKLSLPPEQYVSLRHALSAAKSVPFESGYRTPLTPEARLLSLADQSSGAGNLYARQSANDGGWGVPHRHLGNQAPFTVLSKPASPHSPA